MPFRVLSQQEVADYLHLTAEDIERLLKNRDIPFEMRGSRPVFRKRDIDAWASQRILKLSDKPLAEYHQKTTRATQASFPTAAIMPEMIQSAYIAPRMTAKTKASIIRDMVALAVSTGRVYDERALLESVEAREELCATAFPGSLALLHSRYQRVDRATNEEKWVRCFGKQGHAHRRECGRILVGTQVLEQSLDIDADFLVTRICPTDMLFQRVGRLWRHREADTLRPSEARREAWILAPTLEDSRKEASVWGKIGKVYMPYVLYRSLDVWRRRERVELPQDIRPMLEATYVEQPEVDAVLLNCKNDVSKNREKLERLARIGLAAGARTLPESKATTRYSETESCEVLLLRKKTTDKTGTMVTLLNGKKLRIPQNGRSIGPKENRRLAAELQQNVVLVPEYLAPATSPKQIQWLKDYVYIGEWDESPFRVALVQTDGCVRGIDSGSASESYDLSYNSVQGYRAQKRNESEPPRDLW